MATICGRQGTRPREVYLPRRPDDRLPSRGPRPHPEDTEHPDYPEHPGYPQHPGYPEHPGYSQHPDYPEDFEEPFTDEPELHGVHKLVHLVVLPVLSVMLLGWSLTTFVGDRNWGQFSVVPPLLASLTPLLTVLAIPLIGVALSRRNWVALAPAAVAAVLPWAFVIGYVIPADPPRGDLVPLRAMLVTANRGTADARAISDAARTQRADLVVVTEVSSALVHDLTTAGLARTLSPRYVSLPKDGGASAGIVVYSRFPVDDVKPFPGTHWPAVRARVTVGTTPVTLVAGRTVTPVPAESLDLWRQDLRVFGEARRIKGPAGPRAGQPQRHPVAAAVPDNRLRTPPRRR